MSKIKEITSRLHKNPYEFASVRFLVARQIFILNVALYFLVYLFTVGGFYFGPFSIDVLAQIRYHLYSLLVISTAFFGYSIMEYINDRAFRKNSILIVSGIIATMFVVLALMTHLGLFLQK